MMTLPLSLRPSRQCSTILTDDDIDALDTLCDILGESRSSLIRSYVRLGIALATDPVTALPALLEGITENMTKLAVLHDEAA